jgi:membrane fusion protein (multidrug efflux system)
MLPNTTSDALNASPSRSDSVRCHSVKGHALKTRVLVVIAVALVGAAAISACQQGKKQEAAAEHVAPIQVETVVVDERPVAKYLTVTGTLEADQRTELAANASGLVVRTFIERGDHVQAGALLAQLDSRRATFSHAEAEANSQAITSQLAAVRAECARYENLHTSGAIAQDAYERQVAQCRTQASSEEAARARLADAARVLQDSAIRAPFKGVIGERFVNVGDYVQPSSKIATLLVDDPLRLRISVPEPAIPFAREGTVVRFKVLGLPGRDFAATIKYVGREVRPTTRDMVDEAVVDNREHLLLPGAFVTVDLPVREVPMAVLPKTAVLSPDNEPTVFAVVDQHLERRAVHIGAELADGVAISEGIKKGDRVVVQPSADLKDGAVVQ